MGAGVDGYVSLELATRIALGLPLGCLATDLGLAAFLRAAWDDGDPQHTWDRRVVEELTYLYDS